MANFITQLTTATSGTVTCSNTQQDLLLLHKAGLTVSLTVAFPANPKDGQKVTLYSKGGVTTLTLSAVVGSIISALTGMAAGASGTYVYVASENEWYKI